MNTPNLHNNGKNTGNTGNTGKAGMSIEEAKKFLDNLTPEQKRTLSDYFAKESISKVSELPIMKIIWKSFITEEFDIHTARENIAILLWYNIRSDARLDREYLLKELWLPEGTHPADIILRILSQKDS